MIWWFVRHDADLDRHPEGLGELTPEGSATRLQLRADSLEWAAGMIAGLGADFEVVLWDPRTGKRLRALKGHSGNVTSLAFSPDGGTLASSSGDGTVELWKVFR